MKIKINNSSKTGELILNADMEYVDNKNINQLAVASSTITVKDNKSNLSLTASLLDSVGSFLESWLFNIIPFINGSWSWYLCYQTFEIIKIQ